MILSLLVEQLPNLPARNEEWQALGIAAGNPFTTWEWASAWWREFGEERRQLILGCRDDEGALVGVLPLYLASRHPRTLRIVGNGAADQLGPVCRPEHREAVAAALRGALAERPGWTVCATERLAVGDGWPQLLGGHRTRRERSLTIRPRTADWDEFLSGYSANFRGQVRKFERRLERDHDLRYRIADDPERVDADIALFLDLHAARWGDRSQVYAGGLEEFHRELARLALAEGFLRLSFLELDGEPCAGIHAFRLGGVDWI
ncbi:MAG TPA: GNAT family N-acetyltransferase, partial [Solirubrobacterales bacterium]|nr:GNAT family N-acetyltransferase [Solirubrobacterales bacterium]